MTVISTEESKPRKQYTYSTSLSFPITFSYIERNEVKCMINDTVLVYSTDYTVPEFDPTSLADNQLNLTLITVPTAGDTITIYRETKQDQQAVFPQNAKFSSQKITEAVDKLTMICQELSEDLETCIQLSKETPIGFNTTLPAPEANQVIQWDENGTQLINYDLRSEINTIDGKANTAISTADDAKTIANGAVNIANSASSTASSAIDIASEALTTAGTAKTKAETAETNSSAAIGTANAAYDAASSAVNTASTANTNANTAVSTANSAMSKATTAKNTADTAASNALSAISTANTASTNASTAINTANNAKDTADAAVVTANAASENASTAVTTATSADETATAASNKVDAFGEDIEAVLEAAEKINELEEAVETATEAATTASNAAENATEAATTATNAAQTATTKAQEATNAVASIKQADWNQTDDTQKDYIKNKPTIPDAQIQSDWNQSDNTAKDYIKNKPIIPDAQIQSDWNQISTTAKDYIKNKPSISNLANKDLSNLSLSGFEVLNEQQTLQRAYSISYGDLTSEFNFYTSIYKITIASNTTFVFPSNLVLPIRDVNFGSVTFELYINMQTVYSLTFPSSVIWQNGQTPDLSTTGKYFLVFRTFDNGTTWFGNLEGKW